MMYRPAAPLLPPDLQDSIRDGNCVAFIGSGASDDCYGAWHKLVNKLCKRCDSKCKVSKTSLPEELLDAAEDAKKNSSKKYHTCLCEHFGHPITRTNPLYDAILSCNFRSYLTTNLDPLLADRSCLSALRCNDEIQWYPNELPILLIDQRTIYYLHGYIGEHAENLQDGSIVLSRSEFDKAYRPNSMLNRFLIETIGQQNICFIGCRLREPAINRVLNICKEEQIERKEVLLQRRGVPKDVPSRYMFLQDPGFGQDKKANQQQIQEEREAEENRLKHFDIQVKWYNDDHSILTRIFRDLANLPKPKLSGLGDGGCQYGI